MPQTTAFVPHRPKVGEIHLFVLTTIVGLCALTAHAQWPQWGGPNRDFMPASTGLADKWPDGGPRELWRSEIGGGHSSIVVDEGRLYTMCREDEQDAIDCYDAVTGTLIWETKYDAPAPEKGMLLDFGPGPHSTPLVAGGRVFAVGGLQHFHCLDKTDGKILWSHNLGELLEAPQPQRGYGASPIAYGDNVIVVVGSQQAGLAAFNQGTGEVAWISPPLRGGVSSPILANIGGRDHLIVSLYDQRAGFDPATGAQLWNAAVPQQSIAIMSTPLFIGPDRFFCTAAYGGGSRMFRVSQSDDTFEVKELWHSRKMKVQHGNVVRQGDYIIGSSGDFGPAFLMAINIETGELVWRVRGYTKCTLLAADGKLIILDQEGNLMLATATAEKLEIHSKAKVLEERSWTVPTLVGTTLYLRDNNTITALDLSAAGNEQRG